VAASVEIHADSAIRRLKDLRQEMSKELDDAAEQITETGAQKAERALRRQGSVSTETGVNSLRSYRIGDHHYATIGRTYLHYVDSGTPPHTPDIDVRLITWASQEGWTVSGIVEHIEEEGTRAHPWIETAFDPIVKTIPSRVAAHARRNVTY